MSAKGKGGGARRNRHADLSATVPLYHEVHLLELVDRLDCPLILILDCVQDPRNLGACLRTAEAAGVDAVVVPRRKSAPISDTVRKIACGAAERLPIMQITNLARTLEDLKREGIQVMGTDHNATENLYRADLTGPLALVLGGEGKGMRRLTRESCDSVMRIPMAGTEACLNVSVAAGVCLFEALRQRRI